MYFTAVLRLLCLQSQKRIRQQLVSNPIPMSSVKWYSAIISNKCGLTSDGKNLLQRLVGDEGWTTEGWMGMGMSLCVLVQVSIQQCSKVLLLSINVTLLTLHSLRHWTLGLVLFLFLLSIVLSQLMAAKPNKSIIYCFWGEHIYRIERHSLECTHPPRQQLLLKYCVVIKELNTNFLPMPVSCSGKITLKTPGSRSWSQIALRSNGSLLVKTSHSRENFITVKRSSYNCRNAAVIKILSKIAVSALCSGSATLSNQLLLMTHLFPLSICLF